MVLNNTNLTEEEKTELYKVFKEYEDVFATHEFDLGTTDVFEHEIILNNDIPIKQKAYNIPYKLKEEIKRQIKELEKAKVIRSSYSPWTSPVVPVKKKDGEIRMCIDYRKLNSFTKRDTYPLPKPQEMFDKLNGCKYFTKLDANKGFYQIKVKDADIEKIAFSMGDGLYEYVKLPFGLTNAPATYQRLMNKILMDEDHADAYMDDIIIRSKTFPDNLKAIRSVLSRLRSAGIKLKPSKCEWAQSNIIFLGHHLSGEGVMPDPGNTDKVKNFPTPKNVKQVQTFLGLAGYYRRFQKDYAKIALPLTNLTKTTPNTLKDQSKRKFEWTAECEEAFNRLKHNLISPPVLRYPDFNKSFILMTDASNGALGAVLGQETDEGKDYVIAYGSRVLKEADIQQSKENV